MSKRKKVTLFYEGSGLREMITMFRENKDTFTLSYNGYTATIKNNSDNTDYFFKKSGKNVSFELTSKIKKEIKASNIFVDSFTSHSVKYFKLNGLKSCKFKKVFNIDIKNAYPTALNKMGFITPELLAELNTYDKADRLKAVGQIATRSTCMDFVNGEKIRTYVRQDELLRSVWFAICHNVGETIDACRSAINSFLFFWFDGIYFTDQSEAQTIIDLIEKAGYKCKFEVLNNFVVSEDYFNVYIKYQKEKDKKNFCLPKNENLIYN
jgi:hypothetical protein